MCHTHMCPPPFLVCCAVISELHHSPLVMKEPFLLRAESLLEVESQRSSGSESSGKKPLVRSTGDCSTPTELALPTQLPPLLLLPPLPTLPGDSSGLWMGLRLWLTFTEVTSWLMSNWKREKCRETREKYGFPFHGPRFSCVACKTFAVL